VLYTDPSGKCFFEPVEAIACAEIALWALAGLGIGLSAKQALDNCGGPHCFDGLVPSNSFDTSTPPAPVASAPHGVPEPAPTPVAFPLNQERPLGTTSFPLPTECPLAVVQPGPVPLPPPTTPVASTFPTPMPQGPLVLAIKLGSGGNKDVYAVEGREDIAIGVLKPGKPASLINEEVTILQKLRAEGLSTVEVIGTTTYDGRPAIIMQRYAQGSKEVVRTINGQVKIVGQSGYLNEKSIADLAEIRRIMVERQVKIDDLQFLIGNDGGVVIADPLKITVGEPPSATNLRTIDQLIKAAQSNVR
jgi:hypothetical protein